MHCYGHALNLVVKDSCIKVKCLKETFEAVREISLLVKKSPKRNTKLDEIRNHSKNDAKSIHTFCPTCWTVRGETLESVLQNHAELLELWEWSLTNVTETEMKGRIIGVNFIMKKFDFYFGCYLGKNVLRETDILSKSLQSSSLSAAEGQDLATIVIKKLEEDRKNEQFEMFWEDIMKKKEHLDIGDPILPRQRKLPKKFDKPDTYHFPSTPKEFFRNIYFEVYDQTVNGIKERFNQPDYRIYVNLQELILKAFNKEDFSKELEAVTDFYDRDFERFCLESQLQLLHQIGLKFKEQNHKRFTIQDVITLMQKLPRAHKNMIPEVLTLMKLILVSPATNAVSERSFSALKRLKTACRSTMSDPRLNNLMTLHINRDLLPSTVDIANEFIDRSKYRKFVFGDLGKFMYF